MPPEPLSNFSPGQRVTIHTMPAQPDLTIRLRELGMHEGTECLVTLKNSTVTGIRFDGSTYAMNKSTTDQIIVEQYKALSGIQIVVDS